jgi:hypothetical protein
MTPCINASQGVEPRKTVEMSTRRKLSWIEETTFSCGCESWLSHCHEFYSPIQSDNSLADIQKFVT